MISKADCSSMSLREITSNHIQVLSEKPELNCSALQMQSKLENHGGQTEKASTCGRDWEQLLWRLCLFLWCRQLVLKVF